MMLPVDYYYNGELRWNFGFISPNKAAVIFACLLPLLFAVGNLAWDWHRSRWLKLFFVISSNLLLLGDGSCLSKTYSRGGALAALVAVLYLLFSVAWAKHSCGWPRLGRSPKVWSTCIVSVLLLALFLKIGLGQRSLEPITTGDASVGHRLVLWRSALQMAVENPLGFGAGKSGEAYMQWYQPVDSDLGYRTMVNSYLTFLVEQGWLWFTLLLVAVSLFWFWAQPGKPGSTGFVIARGLRASILAFLVSGIFSTVMEEPVLWIIPMCCAFVLFAWSWVSCVPLPRQIMIWAFALPFLILSGLGVAGLAESHADPLLREFVADPGGQTISKLALKDASALRKTWVIVPDPKVLGPCYGKLLRQLVTETGVVLELRKSTDLHGAISRLLVTGSAVHGPAISSSVATVLLAPERTSASSAQAWLGSSPNLILLVPSIDEDRRSSFWRHSIPDPPLPHLTVDTLDGVGLRVDWAWSQVIQLIRSS